MKTIQVHTACKSCEHNNNKYKYCKECDGEIHFSELYNADPNCVHDVKAQLSGGVKCTKCPGWFCF